MTSLSPPTDAEIIEWREMAQRFVDAYPLASAGDQRGIAVIDALLDERAAHSATKAALERLRIAAQAMCDKTDAHGEEPWLRMLMAKDELLAVLACLSEPSPTKDTTP